MLVLLSALAILPFWTVRYPVITDYPNHLARWFVLFHMKDPAYHLASMYAAAWGPLPYITPDVLALVLQSFLPIDIVGRCVLSLCVILVVCAQYCFLRQACPTNIALSSFAIFIALNPNFQMGSISNQFSIAFCLLAVALWVSYCRTPRLMTGLGVTATLILAYFSHLSGFIGAGLAMGVYALFEQERWKKLATLTLLSLPSLWIVLHNPSHPGGSAARIYASALDKLTHVIFPLRLYTSKKLDIGVLSGLVLLLLMLLWKRPKVALQPVWLAVCCALLLAYVISPSNYGFGGYVDTRFLPFFYLFALAVIRFDRVPRYLPIGLTLLVLFRIATWEQMFVSQQRELKQLTAAFDVIPRNSRILPLTRIPYPGVIGTADLHHLEYGVIQRGFLDPQLFHLAGVQPISLVGLPYCVNPFCDVAGAPQIDWRQVANSYDYLWVHNDPEMMSAVSGIADLIFADEFVSVYRVRRAQPEPGDQLIAN